ERTMLRIRTIAETSSRIPGRVIVGPTMTGVGTCMCLLRQMSASVYERHIPGTSRGVLQDIPSETSPRPASSPHAMRNELALSSEVALDETLLYPWLRHES